MGSVSKTFAITVLKKAAANASIVPEITLNSESTTKYAGDTYTFKASVKNNDGTIAKLLLEF